MDFLLKNEDDFIAFDRMKWEAMKLHDEQAAARRRDANCFTRNPAQYEMIACYAGKTEPVHEKILEKDFRAVRDPGQRPVRHSDHRHSGHLAVQRLFGSESAARAGDGARLSLQYVSQQAAAEKRRRDDRSSSVL